MESKIFRRFFEILDINIRAILRHRLKESERAKIFRGGKFLGMANFRKNFFSYGLKNI